MYVRCETFIQGIGGKVGGLGLVDNTEIGCTELVFEGVGWVNWPVTMSRTSLL
jgi:hypothetical protein